MKKLIKWMYFRYVYPYEMEAIYKILDSQTTVIYTDRGLKERAEIEREWIPNDKLH